MTITSSRRVLLAALLLAPAAAGGLSASAHAGQGGSIMVEQPWSRPTTHMQKTGVAYLTIDNQGSEADRLIAVEAPVSGEAQLHESIRDGDVMRMRQVSGIDVPAHGKAMLAPGGYHIMLVGLKAPLEAGQTFPMTLTFEHAGKVEVTVTVQSMAGKGDAHAMQMNGKGS